jgi:lipopolysaccharide transport system ATP-binding protein
MTITDTLVKVDGLSKKFCRSLKKSLWYGLRDLGNEICGRRHGGGLRPDEFWAVQDVSFELKRGECLGLIGRNGAGKTTLLRMLNGLIKPDAGRIEMRGRVGALIALGAGFNPILSGRENIYVNASVLGLSQRGIDAKIEEIIDFAEIGEFIDMPVQTYSSGMTVRLGFAVASTLKPDVLLLDEVLAVGDANFRSKCWRRIGELLSDAAVILVSHEAYAISRVCDRAILLEKGRMECAAPANEALAYYVSRSGIGQGAPFLYTHEAVRSVTLKNATPKLRPGDCCEFEVDIDMYRQMAVDHAVVNIIDDGEDVHAQSLLGFPEGGLSPGVNSFRIAIGPLFLTKGNYGLMILMSTAGGKVPLINSRRQVHFHFDSHVSYGPKYYPAGQVHLLQ